jgi:large repetitive protein
MPRPPAAKSVGGEKSGLFGRRGCGASRSGRLARAVAACERLEGRLLLSATGLSLPISSAIGQGLGAPFAIAVADVNGDGIQDLVVANSNGTISILPGEGNGSFGAAETVSDGLPDGGGGPQDLLVTDEGQEIFVTNANAKGTVSLLTQYDPGVFVLSQQGVFSQNGAPVDALAVAVEAVDTPIPIPILIAADGDGDAAISVYGFGIFLPPAFYSVSTSPLVSIVTGDFYQTGYSDMVFLSSDGNVEAMVVNGNQGITAAQPVDLAGGDAVGIAAAELGGGKTDDLIVAHQNGTVTTLPGSPTGFASVLRQGVSFGSATSVGIQTADISGDGMPDLLYTQYGLQGSQSTAVFGNGDGGFNGGVRVSSGVPTALGDVTGDGSADLISGYYDSTNQSSSVGVRLAGADTAPVFSSAGAISFAAGYSATFTVNTLGFPTAGVTESGALPDGVTFTDNGNGTATILGTPAADSQGNYDLTLTASNGFGSGVTQSFVLTVGPPQTPMITSAQSATIETQKFASIFITTADTFPTAALSCSGTLPAGLSFTDNGDGTATISGYPAAGDGGVYDLSITAGNVAGSDPTPLTITVDQPASITSAGQATFTALVPGQFTVATTGYPAPSLRVPSGLPQGLSFTDNGNGTATISGQAAEAGTYFFTIYAENNAPSAPVAQLFMLTVNPGPEFSSADQATFNLGVTNSFSVATANISGPDQLSVNGELPAGVTFTDNGDGTGTLSGTPATAGVYTVSLVGNLGAGMLFGQPIETFSQLFTLTVPDTTAIITANQAEFISGMDNAFTIVAVGTPFPSFTQIGELPSGVTFTDNGNGTATLAGAGQISGGDYPLTIIAGNGNGNAAEQTFDLIVDQAPVFTSSAVATAWTGLAGVFAVTTNSLPAATITESGALPPGLSFQDNGDGAGSVSGTPAAGAIGTYDLMLTAANAAGQARQLLVLTVKLPVAPTIISGNRAIFAVGTSGSYLITATGTGTSLSAAGELPEGLTLINMGNGMAELGGTPPQGAQGIYLVTLEAANVTDNLTTQTLIITVTQAPAILNTSGTMMLGHSNSLAITSSGFPISVLTETGKLPAGVKFHDNGNGTARISGTPDGKPGVYPLMLTARNYLGLIVTSEFILSVDEAPAFKSGNQAKFKVGASGSFAISTSGFPWPTIGTSSPLPLGLALTSEGDGEAVISGAAAGGSAGKYKLILTAGNGFGSAAVQTITLTVTGQTNVGHAASAMQSFPMVAPPAGNPIMDILETEDLSGGSILVG